MAPQTSFPTDGIEIPFLDDVPYSSARSVVERVGGDAIILSRGLHEEARGARGRGQAKSASGSPVARGKTLGTVGYDPIGRQVSALAEAFGMLTSPRLVRHNPVSSTLRGSASCC